MLDHQKSLEYICIYFFSRFFAYFFFCSTFLLEVNFARSSFQIKCKMILNLVINLMIRNAYLGTSVALSTGCECCSVKVNPSSHWWAHTHSVYLLCQSQQAKISNCVFLLRTDGNDQPNRKRWYCEWREMWKTRLYDWLCDSHNWFHTFFQYFSAIVQADIHPALFLKWKQRNFCFALWRNNF